MDCDIAPRVVRFSEDYNSIFAFLEDWKPSCIPNNHVEWLTVSSANADKTDSSVGTVALEEAWQTLCSNSLECLTNVDIERLAIHHNVLVGKWMAFVDKCQVDSDWAKVALGVVKGDLAVDAKVSTSNTDKTKSQKPKEEKIPGEKHVICVWNHNFTDLDDVYVCPKRAVAEFRVPGQTILQT